MSFTERQVLVFLIVVFFVYWLWPIAGGADFASGSLAASERLLPSRRRGRRARLIRRRHDDRIYASRRAFMRRRRSSEAGGAAWRVARRRRRRAAASSSIPTSSSYAPHGGPVGVRSCMRGSSVGLVVPIGISFFIFQSSAYVVDVYRGDAPPARATGEYLAFLSFFPTIVAGPILRASHLLPQLASAGADPRRRCEGALLIAVGLSRRLRSRIT